jgi:hypothetical protein
MEFGNCNLKVDNLKINGLMEFCNNNPNVRFLLYSYGGFEVTQTMKLSVLPNFAVVQDLSSLYRRRKNVEKKKK